MVDAIKEITGVDFWKDMTFEEAKAIAAEKKVPVEKHYTEVGHIINAFFEEFVEENIDSTNICIRSPSSCITTLLRKILKMSALQIVSSSSS